MRQQPFTAEEVQQVAAMGEQIRKLKGSSKKQAAKIMATLSNSQRDLLIRWICCQMMGGLSA